MDPQLYRGANTATDQIARDTDVERELPYDSLNAPCVRLR